MLRRPLTSGRTLPLTLACLALAATAHAQEPAAAPAPAPAEAPPTVPAPAPAPTESAPRKATPPVATIHAPLGGRALSIEELGVVCGRNALPWQVLAGGRYVMPPEGEDAIGQVIDVAFAPVGTGCGEGAATLRLIATGPAPQIDPQSVELSIDEGRADASGQQLAGAVLAWQSGDVRGTDVCFEAAEGAHSGGRCTWSTGQGLLADPDRTQLGLYPRGARPGPRARFFDARGRPIDAESFLFKPARIVVQRLWPDRASVDLAAGQGALALEHPEAVAGVDCGSLTCELGEQGLIVHAGEAAHDELQATLRLRPRVRVRDGKRLLTEVSGTATLLHCPMTVVSGEPYRDNESATVAVRLEGSCARDVPQLTFRANRRRVKLLDMHQDETGTIAMLQVGRVGEEEATITASARGTRRAVIAVAHTRTRALPSLRAVLEVPGFPEVDFVPVNRWARVHVAPPAEDVYAVALPILGVYQTRYQGVHSEVKGDPHAAGLTGLRVALRSNLLPEALRKYDLAVVTDPLLRSVHPANVPARLTATRDRPALVEMICGGGRTGEAQTLALGETVNLPYAMRDNCRVIFHRELLRPEDGVQRIRLQVDVLSVDGAPRNRVDETVTLTPGRESRTVYTHGVQNAFDRLTVRISHVPDDTYYLGASEIGASVAAAQWSVIFGTARARLYATAAFPTGLYRLSDRDHSGVLSLNFGLLSRLTWLDEEGQEGLLSLETGLVVIGIGNAVTDDGKSLTQVGAVIGMGLSVPFANRNTATQASLNVHAWLEIDVTRDAESGSDGRLAFIFGPSLSIGSLGANL